MNVPRDKERARGGGGTRRMRGWSVFVVNWLGVFARTCGVIMCIHVCALPNT